MSARTIPSAWENLNRTSRKDHLTTREPQESSSRPGPYGVGKGWVSGLDALQTPKDEIAEYIVYRVTDVTKTVLHQQDMDERFKVVGIVKLLVDSVREHAIFMLDPKGIICTWNRGAHRLKQYEDFEIIGKSFSVFYRGKPAKGLKLALEFGTYEDAFWRVPKDGSQFCANIVITAVHDRDKNLIGFDKVTRDLTERKKAEQKIIDAYEDASRLKSEFLANMSHEIRTPMNGVMSAATLLNGLKVENEQRELLDIIVESGKTLLKIINDILDYSKIEAHELKRTLVPMGIQRVVEKIKPIEIQVWLEGDLRPVLGDELRIHQVLLNLLDNAVKFTDRGRVDITVTADIRVSVTDTGMGMNDVTLGKLFKPFSQGDTSSRKRFNGNGLELSICKQLIELLDGTLAVKSREGKGSTFTIHLQLTYVSDTRNTNTPNGGIINTTPKEPVKASRPHANILVAEDNPINQTVVLRVLRKLGYDNVDIAIDGSDCLDKYKRKHYDLILMDVQMPIMDGIETTRAIRQLQSDISIIAMTANALKGDDDVCISAGMDDYMSKPLDMRLLATKLEEHLSRVKSKPG
ncbi:sensor histidine kinase/response regulator Fos-1/TcsA [Fimicolochytrium jonesii]|uniref:sensor histidine kinase/response regulator Fos-1/TcsA n=1 Tax=Fimicolochytrium jonesii TaxID=1396493 RepID=UPI0022FE4FDD|nr:sensor histidine kinase/response regulator Fos-1/TcsA [Fimicolochytrium jonesii]KAI8818316.1 sensor histidine kinase/response regulator Fos-1/TcsA [Fimicolochytrium jonesii]